MPRSAATSRLWGAEIAVTIQADSAEEAEYVLRDLTAGTLEHEAVWNATGEINVKQETETVDV